MKRLEDVILFAETANEVQGLERLLMRKGFQCSVLLYGHLVSAPAPSRKIHVFIEPHDRRLAQAILQFQRQNEAVPILWISRSASKLRPIQSDLHVSVNAKSGLDKKLRAIQDLAKIGAWSTRTLEPVTFDSIDMDVILDKLIVHLKEISGSRAVRWILSEEFPFLMSGSPLDLETAVQGALLQSPHFKSSTESGNEQFVVSLRQNLQGLHLQTCPAWIPVLVPGSDNDIVIKVGSADQLNHESIGCFYFEGIKGRNRQRVGVRVLDYLQQVRKYIDFAYQHWKALRLSYLDDLTGLYNQKYLAGAINKEIQRSSRSSRPFSVLFLDVDYFKQVNDSNGHLVGSKILIAVADLIRACIRECDFAFRYGGDEFIVLLIDSGGSGARVVAERIRKRVEDCHFLVDGNQIRLTVSIGLAAYPEHATSTEQLIQMADDAMYSGKHKSRNVVYIAS
jgi:diguanylate cyclase (GGDEF)-like protein